MVKQFRELAVKTTCSQRLGMGQVPKADNIQFTIGEDGKTLRVAIDPRGPPVPKTIAELMELINKAGFGNLFIFEDVLKKLPELQRKATEPTFIDVGERRDGTVSIKVSDDAMEAYVTVTRPYGGTAISRDDVRRLLRASSIVAGLLQDAIERSVRENSGEPVLVAKGTPPKNGEPARFESRVRRASGRQPKMKSDGRVDLRELGVFVMVKPGDVLMVKIPPTVGVPGNNVHGVVLPVLPGEDTDFSGELEGTQRHPRDPNTLIAAVAGRPVVLETSVYVDTNLEIKNVDMSTGNVHFEGDVTIRGDVRAGCKVISSGSVTIGGTVEGASVEADGDIVIELGAIGRGEIRDEHGELSPSAAVLRAGGNIQVRYLYNARVESGGVVTVSETVTHSEVVAKNAVLVGGDGTKKGHIIGGRIVAGDLVQAQVIGSPANVKTFIEVGAGSHVFSEHQSVIEELEKKKEDQEKLHALEQQLREKPRPDLKEKLERASEKLQAEIAELTAKLNVLLEKVGEKQGAKITITHSVCGGTQIQCNGRVETVPDQRGPGTFAIRSDKLTYE